MPWAWEHPAGTADTARRGPRARRPLAAALLAALCRQLADDDERVAYWVRQVRIGILLCQIGGWAVLGYGLWTETPARHSLVVLLTAGVVVLGSPCLMLLPLPRMMRDSRGPLLFYGWSVAVTAPTVIVARIDGGGTSPVLALLFVTLAFVSFAYPPAGVLAVGGLVSATYGLVIALPDGSLGGLFTVVIMIAFTAVCALASANSWAAHDRQALLIRTHATLAGTDPLTGVPNRRPFLQRLRAATEQARGSSPAVVCLVDLDGFKGVNDREGHAAGDAVLQAVTAALAYSVRETDTVARLGGDEFAVLAEVSPSMPAEVLAERLRDAVAAAGRASGVTASVGLAQVRAGDDVHDLLYRADAAMYRAKTAGGNRVTALV
jgi:diguanylate cyclase (GGDEF)-like protein